MGSGGEISAMAKPALHQKRKPPATARLFCRGGSLRPPAVTAESALQQERQEGFTPQGGCVSNVMLCRCGNPSTGSAGPPPFRQGRLGVVRHIFVAFLMSGAPLRREGTETLPYIGWVGLAGGLHCYCDGELYNISKTKLRRTTSTVQHQNRSTTKLRRKTSTVQHSSGFLRGLRCGEIFVLHYGASLVKGRGTAHRGVEGFLRDLDTYFLQKRTLLLRLRKPPNAPYRRRTTPKPQNP